MTDLIKVTVDTQDLEASLNYAKERNSAQDDLLTQVQGSIAALEDELHGVTPTPDVDVALANLNQALTDLTAIVSTDTDSLLAIADRVAALEAVPPVDLSGITGALTDLGSQLDQLQADVAALPPPTPSYDDTDLKSRVVVLEGLLSALVPYDDSALWTRLTADEVNTLQSLSTITSRVANVELRLVADEARIKKLEGGTNPTPPSTGVFISPFSASSPWNTKILNLGAKQTDNWGTKPWPSRAAVPVFVADPAGTTWTVVCPQATVTSKFVGTLVPGSDGDHALCLVIDNDVWSFWVTTLDGTNHFSASLGIKCPLNGPGVGYKDTNGNGVKAGTRASGFSILGGLITGQNLANKVIPHVLAGAIPRSSLLGTPPGYVAPAVTADGGWQTTYTGTIPNGSLWGIPKTMPCPSPNVDCQTVWTALQTYGLLIGDATSTGLAIYLERTTTTDAQATSIGSLMPAVVANLCPVTA